MAERTFRALRHSTTLGPYEPGDVFTVDPGPDGLAELDGHPGTWLYVDNLVKYGDLEEVTSG